jgi:hypothetical protein
VVSDQRKCGGESGGVRMRGPCEHLVGAPLLDDAPGVHHRAPLADEGEHREVVGDEDHRERELALETLEELEHLRLHHHVERSRRLVGDEDARIARQRRHQDALALAA